MNFTTPWYGWDSFQLLVFALVAMVWYSAIGSRLSIVVDHDEDSKQTSALLISPTETHNSPIAFCSRPLHINVANTVSCLKAEQCMAMVIAAVWYSGRTYQETSVACEMALTYM